MVDISGDTIQLATKTQQITALQLAADTDFIRGYGYIGNGVSHPLSSLTSFGGLTTNGWSLSQWQQAFFPSAQSLSNEVDGCAIQTAVNASGNNILISFPAGKGLLSYPIVTPGTKNVSLIGAGPGLTILTMVTSGQDLWQHGLSTAGSAYFGATGIQFACRGTGGSGLNISFSGTASLQWIFVMQNMTFQGENGSSDYWAQAVTCLNMPRGLSWRDVICFGKANVITPTNAYQLNATLSSYSYYFDNCMAVGYEYGWGFGYQNNSNGRCIEGVTFYNCQAYSGAGFCIAVNDIANYSAASYLFDGIGWQGTGPCLTLTGLSQVLIDRGYHITNGVSGESGINLISLSDCVDVSVSSNFFGIPAGTSGVTIFRADAKCVHITYRDNVISNFGGLDQIFLWDAGNPDANTIFEMGTQYRSEGGSTVRNALVNDLGGNQQSGLMLSELVGQGSGGGLNSGGIYILRGSVTGTTDATGSLSVLFPSRPGTGKPLFIGGAPVVTVTPINTNTSTNVPFGLRNVSATGFEVQFGDNTGSVTWGFQYIAIGL